MTAEITEPVDPEKLPPTFPVLVASKVISIGKNQTYRMLKDGTYPLPVKENNGRFTVSRYDLLRYLHAPGYHEPEQAKAAAR